MELSLPDGTHLERTEGVVRNLEVFLQQNFSEHISHLYSRVGPTGTASAGSGDDAEEVLADESNAVIHVLFSPDSPDAHPANRDDECDDDAGPAAPGGRRRRGGGPARTDGDRRDRRTGDLNRLVPHRHTLRVPSAGPHRPLAGYARVSEVAP